MVVVVFEFVLDPDKGARYFELARALREEVAGIDGFLSVERFRSLADEGRFVSISFWRDLEAVARWRRHLDHRRAQEEALGGAFFRDFRITVAEAVRSYGKEEAEARRTGGR